MGASLALAVSLPEKIFLVKVHQAGRFIASDDPLPLENFGRQVAWPDGERDGITPLTLKASRPSLFPAN